MNTETTTTRQERYLLTALVEDGAALTALEAKIRDSGAQIVKTEDLGTRRLFFPVAKKNELQLVSVFFETDPATVPGFEAQLRHEAVIKRFLLTKWTVDPNAPSSRSRRVKPDAKEEGHV